MLPPELVVLLAGQPVGVVRRAAGDRLSFVYDDQWRDADGAYPLSLSLPLLEREHGDAPIRAYLEGLLPDRTMVRESWGKRFQVSGKNAYGLLAHIGEDCPGAVQFFSPDRASELIASPAGPIEWLNEAEIAERLRNAIEVYGKGAPVQGNGYFSLAGAQPKTVLYRDGDRWAIPTTALASTHLLKPPALGLSHFALNEHLCMLVAEELGLSVAQSEVLTFDDEIAIVVERFDRVVLDGGSVQRIHQEDFCQALGVRPASRYENEGGPSAIACARLLMQHATGPDDDLGSFVDALALNWVILGTDAHAKNFAFLYQGVRPSLAPLYDIISILPYPDVDYLGKARLAMRIGTEYRATRVRRRHWRMFAQALEVDEEPLLERVEALVCDVPAALEGVREHIAGSGVDEPFADQLLGMIDQQVPKRLRALER
jgi:serine/threonine-protein kinase HipA